MTDIDWKGGIVSYDECRIDPSIPLEEQTQELREDLLQADYPQGYTLDLGWYPENDPSGRFKIQVIRGSDWQAPRLVLAFRDMSRLELSLQKAAAFICAEIQARDQAREERPMNIQIKPMETPEEIEGKAYVHWKAWQEAYAGLVDPAFLAGHTLEKCTKTAYQWPDGLLVAKDGGRVIGFAGYGKYRDDSMPETGELYALYILSGYYGTGVGKALMDAALERLAGYPRIALWVLKGNARAIRFYEKCGFGFDGTEQTIRLGQENTELRMVRGQKPAAE